MSTKVSVIIPAYNIEDYIEDCLNSIIGQTLKDIEIICVNDGSTDSTLNILNDYAKKDSRVKVVSQENGGQSLARNSGLTIASGKYVYFMDGDDILDSVTLEEVYNTAAEKDLDVVYFDGTSFSDEEGAVNSVMADYYTRKNDYPDCCKGIEMFCLMSKTDEYRASPCLQLIKREHLIKNEINFHIGIIYEDNVFTLFTMIFAERAGYIKKVYFNRRIRSNSTTTASKQFRHSYGYYICSMDISAVENKYLNFSDDEKSAVYSFMCRLLRNARAIYADLSEEEKAKRNLLDCRDRAYFEIIVAEPGKMRQDLFAKIAAIKKSSDINSKLQKADEEKTEINRKLQIAYKEKEEKDKEIKRLKKYSFYPIVKFIKKLLGKK